MEIGPNSADWTADESEKGVLRWKLSDSLCSGGPIHVSVTEITNDVTLRVDGEEYNMGSSRTETTTLFTESPQVRDLNSNGKINISRPAAKLVPDGNGGFTTEKVTTTSSFRIHSEWPWGDDEVVKPGNWQAFDETVEVVPGAGTQSYRGLSAGRYTIEDLSVSGYNIQLGEREQEVGAGETGTFYINSKPGRLTITAKGGENEIHYYTVKRVSAPEGAEEFADRTTESVASGASFTLENLPRGPVRGDGVHLFRRAHSVQGQRGGNGMCAERAPVQEFYAKWQPRSQVLY